MDSWPPQDAARLAVLGARVQRARRAAAPRNNTVATHVTRILTKLGAASRTEAAAKARESGLLDAPP